MKLIIHIKGRQRAGRVEEAHTANEKGQHWQAVLDNYEGGDPIGWGDTPDEAIEDLRREIEWRADK